MYLSKIGANDHIVIMPWLSPDMKKGIPGRFSIELIFTGSLGDSSLAQFSNTFHVQSYLQVSTSKALKLPWFNPTINIEVLYIPSRE